MSNGNILVVFEDCSEEDANSMLLLFNHYFSKHDYQVFFANSKEDGLKILEATDILTTVIYGISDRRAFENAYFEFAKSCYEKRGYMVVIHTRNFYERDVIGSFNPLGGIVWDYLRIPFHPDEIERVVRVAEYVKIDREQYEDW